MDFQLNDTKISLVAILIGMRRIETGVLFKVEKFTKCTMNGGQVGDQGDDGSNRPDVEITISP